MNNYEFQAGALRHYLPMVEKNNPDGALLEQYQAALETLEYLAEKQKILREWRKLELSKPELNDLAKGIL